ncbi:MAG: regulator of sirC expression with transglutaminase-like and TPR domain [Cellvibrionaceae bacterium]|jgi:regulator of sirC expression with transglutaminase-like and TPR domain
MSVSYFQQLVKQEPVPLLEASLLLVKNIVDPGLDLNKWIAEIDSLAREAAGHIADFDTEEDRMLMLATWLFGPHGAGFSGNRRHYGDPRNSFLNEVLERKLGIPISLSIIYLETAERLGISLTGIGLPGHFVVGGIIKKGKPPILIDPFNHGKRLTLEDCTQLISQTTGYRGVFQAEWLQPTSSQMILIRVLNNLRIAFMRQENWQSAILVFKHLQILQPKQTTYYRDEGLIHYHIQQYHQSSILLEKYLELDPNAKDLDMIKKMVGEQLTRWARLN